jgi:tetratricopeptide (TPR) repeat protein
MALPQQLFKRNWTLFHLWMVVLFVGVNPLGARESAKDSVSVASILKKAEKTSAQQSDSSIIYYQEAINFCRSRLTRLSGNKKERDLYSKQLAKAELGIGLVYYRQLNYQTALQHYNSAFKLAKELYDNYYIGQCLFNYAEVDLEQSKYSLAMSNYFNALQEFIAINDQADIYWCYIGMGIVQKNCGNLNDAVICYEKAFAIAQKELTKLDLAYALNNLGVVYRRKGDYAKAMDMYEKALSCFTEMKDEPSASDCLNNIANLYLDQGDTHRALDYMNRSIRFEKVQMDNYRMISRYMNLSNIYSAMNDLRNASVSLDKAIVLAGKSEDQLQMASCYSQAGHLSKANGDIEKGISYYTKSADLFHGIGAKVEEAECLVELAKAEMEAGRLDEAFVHAGVAESLALSSEVKKTMLIVNECLSILWERKGNPDRSLTYLRKAVQLKDSIFTSEKSRAIEEIEAGFVRTRLEDENQLLQQKAKLQQQSLQIRTIALVSVSLILALAFGFAWLGYKRYLDSKAIAREKEAIRQKEIELLNDLLLTKQRELTAKTLSVTQKNNLIERLISEIKAIRETPDNVSTWSTRMQRELKQELSANTWKQFEIQFSEVHPGFQERLIGRFPDLTANERRLCSFIRLSMNSREIVALTRQSGKSIEVARTRIRKKMNLSREESLDNTIAIV